MSSMSGALTIFSVGFALYNLLNPKKADKPKPEELQINTYVRNLPVPIIYGTDKIAGEVIHVGTTEVTTSGGGSKGAGAATTGSFLYYAEFAMALSEGVINACVDVMVNENEIFSTEMSYELFLGEEDQPICSQVADFLGAAAIPWKNTAYLYISGSLGNINAIPNVTAIVSGLLAFGSESPDYVSWRKIDGYPIEGIGVYHYVVANGNYIYAIVWQPGDDGNVYSYCVDPKEETWTLLHQWSKDFTPVGNTVFLYNPSNNTTIGMFEFYYDGINSYLKLHTYDLLLGGHVESLIFWHSGYTFPSMEYSGSDGYSFYVVYNVLALDRHYRIYTQNILGGLLTQSTYTECDVPLYLSDGWQDIPTLVGGDSRYRNNSNLMNFVTLHGYCYWQFTNNQSYKCYLYRCTQGQVSLSGLELPKGWAATDIMVAPDFSPEYSYLLCTGLISPFDDPELGSVGGSFRIYKIINDELELQVQYIRPPVSPSILGTRNGNMVYNNGSLYIVMNNVYSGGASPSGQDVHVYQWRINSDSVTVLPTPDPGFDWRNFGYGNIEVINGKIVLSECRLDIYTQLVDKYAFEIIGDDSGIGLDANPIEVTYDFMTNKRYGLGISPEMFDGSPLTTGTWRTEYLFCNELILNDDDLYEARFVYSNVFKQKKKAYDIIEDILQTCRGYLYYCDGLIKVGIQKSGEVPVIYFGNEEHQFASSISNALNKISINLSNYPDNYWLGDSGKVFVDNNVFDFIIVEQTSTYITVLDNFLNIIPQNSTVIIRKDNIKKGSFQFADKDLREKHNRIRLEYINREDDYRTDVVDWDNIVDIHDTQEIREISFSMKGIKRNTQARRMLQYLCDFDNIVRYSCSFETDILGLFVCVGTIIGISYVGMNWIGKLFRVINFEELDDYNVKLELIEYIESVYHDHHAPKKRSKAVISLPDMYDVPGQVERLFVFQEMYKNKILISFKKPSTNNTYWIGALLYIKEQNESLWSDLGISYINSPSVLLSANINSTVTSITYNESTMNRSFPVTGTFFIDSEEIFYNGIDDDSNQFLNCVRGYNGSIAASHSINSYCVLRQGNTFSYDFEQDDIGKTFIVKAVSITSSNVVADGTVSPTVTFTIDGNYLLPYPVGNLHFHLQ